jgi:hypothetical protein
LKIWKTFAKALFIHLHIGFYEERAFNWKLKALMALWLKILKLFSGKNI